jgi:hypothetical protein
MSDIPPRLRRRVVRRAGDCCEYCRLSQSRQEATFHIDHVIPRAAGGPTVDDNLALACVSCSLQKGARQTAVDPKTGAYVPLYHPRRDVWREHFRWKGTRLVGRTPTGRATVDLLRLNRARILAIREEEEALGRHPPPGTEG